MFIFLKLSLQKAVIFTVTWMVMELFPPSPGVLTSPMLVHLAGVELTPEGRVWLQKNLTPAQTVWLKLISREDDALHCLVSQSRVRHFSSISHIFVRTVH